ncbi:uncharacterized protein LOC141638972 [Silene latifolia]|uniref:uncharacterized protein LOC141638972 n=1 Tax=Silene latifolia TaxID=37657 RepID=UPI003D77705C
MGWHKGSRIWVFWKPDLFDIQFISYSAQHIHMLVHSTVDNKKFQLTMIYAFNGLQERIALWNTLKNISATCCTPWLWLGDFNTVLSPIERLGGNTTDAEMETIDRVYSRLDRAMGNQEWLAEFANSLAHFHPEGLFDHCPCTIVDRNADIGGKKSFKYFNMWGLAPSFKESVAQAWTSVYRGTKMFSVIKKLKALKPILKSINRECFSDVENNTSVASLALEHIQKALVDKPGDTDLIQQEAALAHELRDLVSARDSFLLQKAKVQWSLEGDLNTSYFHHVIKKRMMLNKVFQIEDLDGNLCIDGDSIQRGFFRLLSGLLGSSTTTTRPVTSEEVKNSIFSIPKDKSPCPDGYTSQFFRDAWDVIGTDVCAAVINFFETGKLLVQLNATIITLIPKLDRPTSVKHFRPISCCNVLYKAISKILCNRLALVLPDLISKNQGAFVKGRSILENILICQDLVRLYHRGNASPRCMFKLDLQKAYDSIEWAFIDQMLGALMFPEKFRQMIMTCVTTSSFTLNLNGAQFGYFKGRRGLRQGDPISPLLFCLCMEYLSRIMEFATRKWYFRTPLVSWHDICFSKKEGGLGIKNAGVWNVASVGKLVHWLYTKADRLWVLWIDHVYMKGADWAHYQPPPDSNWNWRNICRVRGILEGGYQGNTWVASPGGYSVSSGYHWMQGSHPPVLWYKDVWDNWLLPKHSFIAWLIQKKALNTRVKLHRLGVCLSDTCALCEVGKETHDHLFAECDYSARVIAGVEEYFHICFTGSNHCSSKIRKKSSRLARIVTYYMIWNERNVCRLTLQLSRPELLVSRISQYVHDRLVCKMATVVPALRSILWTPEVFIPKSNLPSDEIDNGIYLLNILENYKGTKSDCPITIFTEIQVKRFALRVCYQIITCGKNVLRDRVKKDALEWSRVPLGSRPLLYSDQQLLDYTVHEVRNPAIWRQYLKSDYIPFDGSNIEKVFIPMFNDKCRHWWACICDLKQKVNFILDSSTDLHADPDNHAAHEILYQVSSVLCGGSSAFEPLRLIFDCGVFVLKWLDALDNQSLWINSEYFEKLPDYQKKIILELLKWDKNTKTVFH